MEENLRQIIETLDDELEEKVYQMSQIRMVAEVLSEGIQELNYFERVCSELRKALSASNCHLYWNRKREPAGWWRDVQSNKDPALEYGMDTIPEGDEWIFGWVKQHKKALFLDSSELGGTQSPPHQNQNKKSVDSITFPLFTNKQRNGVLVLLNPELHLSPKNINRHLDILCSLINSGINNRLIYQSLSNTNDEYQDVLENSTDMAIVAYPDGIIRDCNQSLAELIGIEGDGRGLQLLDQIRETSGDSFKHCWNKLLQGIEIKDQEILLMDSKNRVIEAEISGNVRRLPDNRIGAIRIYLRDMTERREAERKRSQLEVEVEVSRQRQLAQVGLYVSGIAHNLQNPVQVLLGYIDVAKMKADNPSWLGIIEDATVKIKDIIRNLLDKMRREGSSKETKIDINELLKSELTFLNANPYYKNEVKKSTTFGKNIPPIKGVYGDFTQALMNIVYNALDAMVGLSKKELTISTEYIIKSDHIQVTVTDTGSGIPEEIRENVFKPFYTTKPDQKDIDIGLAGGSGLGLSSSISLLQPYQGEISFITKSGTGTSFKIKIPVGANRYDN